MPTTGLPWSYSRALSSNLTLFDGGQRTFNYRAAQANLESASANETAQKYSVALTVTSPPFLDVVQYAQDNWLRCWFNDLDEQEIASRITMCGTVAHWSTVMLQVFRELYRITAPNGWVAFEVGEVRGGKIRLDEIVAPIGISAGFACMAVAINAQKFTKTANIWGVRNNSQGTNTNRIVLFRKPV